MRYLPARFTVSCILYRLVSALLVAGLANTTAADTRVIHAGTLLAVPGEAPLSEQTLVIKDGMISEVLSGYQDAAQFGDAGFGEAPRMVLVEFDEAPADLRIGMVARAMIDVSEADDSDN